MVGKTTLRFSDGSEENQMEFYKRGQNTATDRTEVEHLDYRVQSDHNSVTEVGVPCATTQIEDRSRAEHVHTPATPVSLLPKREDSIDSVVSAGNSGKDRIRRFTHGPITLNPV